MGREQHLLLLIEYSKEGHPIREPVHAKEVGSGVFCLLYSPGLVQGIAAQDEFRLVSEDGAFEVVRHGGNLAVQVFSSEPVAQRQAELTEWVALLGGSLDGAIERGLVFSVPLSSGFAEIEAMFNDWVTEHAGWEWYYGNVYDPIDGVTPLRWWE